MKVKDLKNKIEQLQKEWPQVKVNELNVSIFNVATNEETRIQKEDLALYGLSKHQDDQTNDGWVFNIYL